MKKTTKTKKKATKAVKRTTKNSKKPAKTVAKRSKTPSKAKHKKTVKKPQKAALKSKKSYNNEKERVRQLAIDWQNEFENRNMSYGEVYAAQDKLERLAKKYGLTKEFRENGII